MMTSDRILNAIFSMQIYLLILDRKFPFDRGGGYDGFFASGWDG